jgi:hypothetical protein
MKFVNWRMILLILLAVGVIAFMSIPADAQCALCKASLAGSNNGKLIRNFNIGVLVLLVPPVSIFCSIFIILRRHRGE